MQQRINDLETQIKNKDKDIFDTKTVKEKEING